MRWMIAALVMLGSATAFADDFTSDAPKKTIKCKQPPCACQDMTKSNDCITKDQCVGFCSTHDGPVKMHKKHRRHGKAPNAESAN